MSPRQCGRSTAQAPEGRPGLQGAETQASWPPACPLPGHTCRVRRERRRGGGGEQTGACAGKQWPPGLPALLALGRRLTREGAAAAHTAAPGDTNKPEGSGQLLGPFLSRAPGALTSLPAQAPDGPHTGDRNSKRNYFQKAGAPKSGDHRLKH